MYFAETTQRQAKNYPPFGYAFCAPPSLAVKEGMPLAGHLLSFLFFLTPPFCIPMHIVQCPNPFINHSTIFDLRGYVRQTPA